ncbi:MAG: Ig-like domain-containing protein [Candidatus Thermoplasmatota archaeon]|nr:Ig-like domain-containing protein [Candidatus Thermoplasmatota archaeon]
MDSKGFGGRSGQVLRTAIVFAFALVLGMGALTTGLANTPPVVVITYPDAGQTVGGIVTIQGLSEDDVEVVTVEVSIDSPDDWVLANDLSGNWFHWEYEWDSTLVLNGEHFIVARAFDGELYSELYDLGFIVQNENSPPHVWVEHPPDYSEVWGIVEIWGHASDPDEGDVVELVQIAFDNTEDWINCTDTSNEGDWWTWEYIWDTTTFEDGWHYFVVRAFDGEDYSELTDIHVYIMNEEPNTPPWVNIEHPPDWSEVSGTVTVWGHSGDPDEGDQVELVQVAFDGTEEWFNATDVSPDGDWHTWEYEWDTTEFEDGWHAVVARAFDGEDYSEYVDIHVYVDNVNDPPTCEIVEPDWEEVVSGWVDVWIKCFDDNELLEVLVMIDETGDWHEATWMGMEEGFEYWKWEWDTTQWEDGIHWIHAKGSDGVHWSELDWIKVIVENGGCEAPTVEIVHPENGEVLSGIVLIHGTADDPNPGYGVSHVLVRIDEGDWHEATDTSWGTDYRTWAFHWNTRDYENGEHWVRAKAGSECGWSDVDVREVIVENDNSQPEVSIIHPEHNEEVSGFYLIHGKAWDNDEGDRITKVQVKIGDGEWHLAKDVSLDDSWYQWAYEWITPEWDDGCYRILARSYDGELWSDNATVIACTDNVNDPPEVEILHPDDGALLSGIVLVNGIAEDDGGVELVQVRIDSDEWEDATDVSGDGSWSHWAYEWNTGEYENGNHTVCARAYDGEHHSELDCVEVGVDNLNNAPELEIVHPVENETVDGEYLVYGYASDPDPGDEVDLVQVKIDDGEWQNATDTSGDGSWSTWAYLWDTTKYDNGNHTVHARAYDGELHSDVVSVDVVVDNQGGMIAPPWPPIRDVILPIALGIPLIVAAIILIRRYVL